MIHCKSVIALNLFLSILVFSSYSPPAKTWVAVGDSITYLNEHANETGDRITRGYMTMIKEKHPHIQYINQGHNGWTVLRIADSIHTLGIPKADIYTVFLGTNDWWRGNPIGTWSDYKAGNGNKTVYGAFRTIIDKFRSLNSTAEIILMTPMQRVDFVYIHGFKNNAYGSYKPKNGQQLSQVADAIIDIARHENFDLVDLYHAKPLRLEKLVKYKRLKDPISGQYKDFKYPDFIDIPFDTEKDEYPYPLESIDMTYDGLHPSDKGYQVISKLLWKKMK